MSTPRDARLGRTNGAGPRRADNGLRAARTQLGLTQSEVAVLLRRAATAKGTTIPEDILSQYKRWETGRCRPSRFYVGLLATVFGPVDGLEPIRTRPPAGTEPTGLGTMPAQEKRSRPVADRAGSLLVSAACAAIIAWVVSSR